MAGLRSQYPQASQAKLRFKLAGRLLGNELAYKVCGRNSIAEMRLEHRQPFLSALQDEFCLDLALQESG
jgi:hypothetical protein